MSTKAPPPIPPRPTRSPNNAPSSSANPPKIPPRPTSRPDRSSPPKTDSFAPSPLNALPSSRVLSAESPIDPSLRPDSATLRLVGPEHAGRSNPVSQGVEVATDGVEQPAETRNVHQDLHLHAPRPSLPTSSATAQVQAVTRTDISHGHETVSEEPTNSKYGLPHIQLESSNVSASRKSYINDEESGIPEIGQRVPMYPDAGDVQAPSPSPGPTSPHGNQDGHSRTRSRQESSIPPGSYGLHGHGVTPDDPFEKSWYQKHPKELALEEQALHRSGVGSPRPEWAMSSEGLNEIVKSSATTGTSNEIMGTPDEEIGNIMTEELASRLQSPPTESSLQHEVRDEKPTVEALSESQKAAGGTDRTHGSQEVKIHVSEPIHHQHHPDGFALAPEPDDKHEGDVHDNGEDVPVLAADEVDPNSAGLQPAVSPSFEHRNREHCKRETEASQQKQTTRSMSTVNKAPDFQLEGQSGNEATPVKHTKEYEPLFPNDDNERHPSPEHRFKSPVSQTHRFPSKDIWEDAPSSTQLHATVSTPDIPKRPKRNGSEPESPFETPEQEQERVREADKLKEKSGLEETPVHLDKSESQEYHSKQRFPSRDIWEEAPESQQLTASVEIPEDSEKNEKLEKPSLPSLPPRPSRQPDRSSTEEQTDVSPTKTQVVSPTELKKRPSIPDRPKPQVPQRPTKKKNHEAGETLTKTISGEPTDEAVRPVPRAKPAIPPRGVGPKIAALKAGFLSDLDSRLKLGPPAPKPKEKESEEVEKTVEKGPLSDARKGRARGPPRRKPAVKANPAVEEIAKPQTPEIKIADPWNIWSIGPDGEVNVSSGQSGNSPFEPNDIQSEFPVAPPPTKATVSPPSYLEAQPPDALNINKAVESMVIPKVEDNQAISEVPSPPAVDEPASSHLASSEHQEESNPPMEADTHEPEEDKTKPEPYSGLKASEEAPNAAGIMDKEAGIEETTVPAIEAIEIPASAIESKVEAGDANTSEKQ
ncbi:hypothetical protein McanMca71_005234 [Microsporum canis]